MRHALAEDRRACTTRSAARAGQGRKWLTPRRFVTLIPPWRRCYLAMSLLRTVWLGLAGIDTANSELDCALPRRCRSSNARSRGSARIHALSLDCGSPRLRGSTVAALQLGIRRTLRLWRDRL